MCLLVLVYLRDVSDLVLCMRAKSFQSRLTLRDLVDCRAYQAPLHDILQARILEWVAMPSSRGSSKPKDRTRSPTLQADSLQSEPPGKPLAPMHIVKSL